jgi:hypothetical protein
MASEDEMDLLAKEVVDDILRLKPKVVMCQGEFTLTYRIVSKLKENNIKVVAACSERVAKETKLPDGTTQKVAIFEFVRFREF